MPGPDKFTFDLSKLRGIYDTMRNKGYRESWEEFKGGMVGKDKYQVRKRIFDALKSNNDTSAKNYEDFVEGLRFVAPAKPKVAAAPKLDLPKPSSGGKPADGSEFFGKVMRGENVSGSEPIVPKRQDYGGFDKMMTADGRPLTGDATDTWERKLVRDHGKEAGLDDEQIRRIEDGLKVKNIVADMEQTKRDAAKIGRSEASSADLVADASYHDETSRDADRRRRESGNYNTQVEFDRLKNNNPLIKTWKLSDHLSSVRNNDEEWLATGEKWYDENEGVFKSRVISNYGNEYVRSESVDEVIGRLKKESEELGRKVDERQLELYGGDKTKRTIADATATLTGQKLIFGMDPQLYHDEYGRSLAAAKRKIDERIETLEGHRDDPGFWAGVGERLSSRDWWTLGASDVADLSQDLVLKQKIENGEELSDADVAYLRSSMYADRDGQFYGERGFLNRAGKLTADAIPFVAEFVFTGGGMNALQGATKLGMKAATQVGKNALKRAAAREAKELAADVTKDLTKGAAKKALGTRAKMWLLKNTGVVADDLARAGVMANTVGAGRTAGDAIGRYVGSVGVDDEGKFVYEGGVSAGEALLKAEVGNTLEYYTEMLGNHLKIGDWVAKGTEKIGAGKLSKAIKWAGSNKWLEKGGIQDLPSEGLEEEANIVLNSMLVGDNKLSDLWDGETQADIWGGMALSVGFMRSVAAAHEGYVWSRYKMQERKVERADVVAGYRFGDMADWSALKERIDGTTNEDMKGVVMSIMNDDGLHAEQKKAALDYVGSLMQLRGYNLGSVNDANDKEAAAKEAKENGDAGFVGAGEAETEKVEGDMEGGEEPAGPDAPTSNSETAALPGIDDGEQDGPVSAAFNRGREADAQERQDIAIELTDPSNAEAQEAWNGVVQRINEDADLRVAQQRAQTKEMQHKDGNVRPAILKEKDSEGNDQQVYIVDGNVEMMPDGSMVDKAASDNIVVVYNPATGERKQIDPTADDGISSLGEVTTAEQREADIERSRKAYVQAQIDEAQGTVRVVPGQQLVLPTGEEGVVVAIDAEGEDITVALGDGRQATVQRSELQRIRDEKALADYRQRHGITEEPAAQQAEGYEPAQPQAEGRVAGAPADYTSDMELTIRDEDGSEKPAMVMGRVRYENGSFVPDENGKIIEYYMDGEVKHAHEDVLSRDVVGYVAPHQTEAAPVEEASAETPATVETTPPSIEQQAEAVSQPMQTEEPMPAQPAIHNADESNLDITSRERVKDTDPMPVREDGEEDWQATTPERAHAYIFNEAGLSRSEGNEFIAAQIQAAQSALMKASSANMPKVGTSIRKYNEAKAKRQEKIDEAQRVLDYWNSVREIQNAIAREENERRAAEDAARHEEAVAQVQAEYEARKRAEAERKAVGHENPMPAITEKWDNATKVDGHSDEIMLPDGTALKGHYVLHESGASSPSHNPVTWQKTEGFPMDVNGGSVNDRDYERDLDAQEHTQRIAREYDQRALQNVPVVSNDGVVLSGNGRTMAGELAARDNTDGAYVNYLKEYAPKFGFTAEQVGAMQHPRVSFVPDEAMPYTAETFAKFNQQEMKSQNKTEMAVKLGKTVSDDSFKGIVRTINGYETLGDFYNDADASLGAVYDLHNAGVVPQAQLAEMVDGVRGQEKLSTVGREFLENMLIGKAFEGAPDVVRMLTAEPLMRQTVITALGEIVDNIALGGGWSLQGELADAVKLCFDARQGGAKYGEIVRTYARQGVLFADPDELQTVADFNNATMLMLADVLNDKRVTLLKTTLQLYNNNARESASGQADMFAGGVRSREDILRDVINFINENYGKRKEIEAARAAAVERRKAEGVVAEDKPGGTRSITSKLGSTLVGTGIQQNGTPPAVGGGSEDAGRSERGTEETPTERELADNLRNRERQRQENILPNLGNKYSLSAEQANNGELFYQDAEGNTNLAVIPDEIFERLGLSPVPFKLTETMGWHVYDHHAKEAKLSNIGDAIDFVLSIIKNVDHVRLGRNNSYIFSVENGRNKIGKRAVTIVVNSETGEFMGISTSGYETLSKLKERPLLWERGADFAPEDVATPTISTIKSQQGDETLSRTKGQSNASSDGKGKVNSSTAQAKGVKVAENQSPSGVEVAEGEVNTEPTEAQKQAGNYKKGHVKIDGFDVTIENPKGSVRRGTDASGKQWEQEMQNTYGYIRGTEGVDGDHIDVFLSDNPSQGDVFVVDQVNKDGTFDEHKVMYGFPDIESARKAYLSNYEDGWTGLGAITPVSKEEFKKWVKSSRRKTKPFAEYKGVKPLGDTQLGEQSNKPTVKLGEDYVSAAERIAKEHEVKRTAAHFAEETQEEATAFDKRVPEMDDVELLAYMQEDGRGDLNKAHHPSVYDEYDYRHGDEQLRSYDDTLVRLNESGTTLEQAEDMLANIRRDKSLLATDRRADLLGQEDALQDYIVELKNREDQQVRQQKGSGIGNVSPREAALRDALVDVKRGAGVEVVTDVEEGQRELDEVNGEARLQAMIGGLQKASDFIVSFLKGKTKQRSSKLEIPERANRLAERAIGHKIKSHTINANELTHSKKRHGINGSAITEKSIPLRDEDFALMPYIMSAPTRVVKGSTASNGTESVRYEKELPNGVVVVVEREGKFDIEEMENITMWAEKKSATNVTVAQRASHSTSETIVISEADAAKIRKDAEDAIRRDEYLRLSRSNGVVGLKTPSPVFYSNAERAVMGISQKKATAEQWLAMIKKLGGIKAGEDKWLGLSDWLESRKGESVTKDEVLGFIRENRVEIEEVDYSADVDVKDNERMKELQQEFDELMVEAEEATGSIYTSELADWAFERMVDRYGDDFDTAFYPEVENGECRLVANRDYDGVLDEAARYFLGLEEGGEIHPTRLDYTTDGLEHKKEIAFTVPTIAPWHEEDAIHFGDAGGGRAVAWVRFGETTDGEGRRVLVIDEIQSNRHQEGREKGYVSAGDIEAARNALAERELAIRKRMSEIDARMRAIIAMIPDDVVGIVARSKYRRNMHENEEYLRLDDEREALSSELSRMRREVEAMEKRLVPDAPFEKNWHEMVMKRMLRYAAEMGYDKVAWTKGAQQAERYELGRQVDEIRVWDNSDGVHTVVGIKDGQQVFSRETQGGESGLAEVVGKDMARKAYSNLHEGGDGYMTGDGYVSLRGKDLSVGGVGMRGFYDEILPRFMDKYGKKWGVKTEDVELPKLYGAARVMHAVDVTDAMKESVMEGQPMFFRTKDGRAYGFVKDGRIYIDPRIATAETPIHEYCHLWASAMRELNPKEWRNIVELMKGTAVWDDVKRLYPELKTDDAIGEEVLAHYSGRRGAERLRAEQEKILGGNGDVLEKAAALSAIGRVKEALKRFWKGVADWFGIHFTSAEEVADKVLSDLLNGVNPVSAMKSERGGVRYEANSEEAEIVASARMDAGATDVRSIAQRMDEERGTEVARFVDFLRRGKLVEGESRYFHVGDTGGLLNEYGISGKITVSSSAANSHHNKDKDHLSDTDWVDVFDKINEPIAITRYGDRPNSFRIYTIVEKNGKNICVGVDVNSVGRNVNITNIKTGFARDIANALNEELVYPGSRQELETAIQERSLRHNREVYPEQPYDAAKVVEEIEVPKVWDEKNSDGADEAYLANVNSRFNERLMELLNNPKQKARVLHLGIASKFLQKGGISNAEIILEYDKVVRKSKEDYKNDHPFSISDIKNLPLAIHHPIAVFDNTNGKDAGRVILTELKKDGRNFIVVVRAREQHRKGGVLLEINEISTLYPKEAKGILKWIIDRNYTNIDKEKALRFIEELQPHAGTTIKREELVSAAKVVEDFENARMDGGKVLDSGYREAVNARFNAELGRLTEENKDKVVLSLGRPSAVLLSAGVEDKSMKLYGNKVIKKMKKHGFALDELRDLPRAVADPIAVFDNYQLEGNRTVLTELQSKGENIMVAVTLGKDGVDVDFNIVSSVFGKGEDNIVDWLNKGYARYINKEKALNYLHHSDRHISEALSNPKLVSATKVVEDFVNPVVVGEKNEVEDSARYRTSEDLTEEYGDSWLTEQTNDDGRHTTQVKNTINSYKKFGEWVKKDSRGREVSVLDASSGLGLGTHWMRENGMSVDDVEPYPSADREEPTFGSYDEIDKQYDYIISNAVLNVIPDDWRASLLHDMASKLKPGGKLVINVRGAESIRRQGNEGMTRITLDDPSEILVLRPDGSIKAYQKGFTKDELQDWCEEELGDGYTVLKASRDNAGGTYDTAVVVIKNNESTTKGSASELGQPTENGAALANFGAMIGNNSERAKRLSDLSLEISRAGAFGSHQLLHGLNVALDLDVTPKEGGRMSTDHSRYYDLGNGVSLRIADHQGDANTFARFGHPGNNYGIVIKLSRSRFKDKDGVDYLEYVYYGDRIVGAGRQKEIVDGLRTFVESGDLSKLPRADKVNGSGRFKDAALPQQTERSSSAKRLVVEELAEKLHTDINIIEDVNEITHPNAAVQERRRKSKGWYDTATGQVNIVLDNNRDVDDVKASVGHETIAHKGLRELVGEENYDEFLDETYQHLRDDLKQGVDAAAGRAFVDDVTKNGKRAKSYEQHRRTAVDELFGRLAEKPFEEFTEGERTLWQKLKAAVRKLLDKFLGSLKLPKWFELGDNELRYILWRSKERLERGREHPIDLARDIVKREELGLTDAARYNMGDAPETFKARQRRAVENKGTVMPGLNGAQVKVVDVPRHSFTGTGRQAIDKAKIWANGHLVGTHTAHQIGNVFDYNIDKDAIDKFLSSSSTLNSENLGVHLAVLSQLPNVINNSVEVEEHPDYKKVNGKRKTENGVGDSNLLVHRMYGAVQIDGNTYRVKTTMHEHYVKGNAPHDYRVTKIELLISGSPTSNALSNSIGEVLDGQTTKPLSVSSRKSNTTNGSKRANGYVHVAKLLQDVVKSYDLGKKLLEESKISDESTDLYREGDDVSPDGATSPSPQQNSRTRGSAFGSDDIWTDGSMGLQERMTAAATRLANNHREDKTLRNDAMRAIGGNLADLRKAMSLQRTFDRTTVKRVADLARVLITNGYINNATSGEIKRLLSVVKNSVGHNDIESDVQKVMDIMVDNQLKHAEETLHELEAIKGSKVDARGVEVQGQLDAEGQTLIKSMKEAQKIVNPCGGKTHDENGKPTAWGNALESAIMRMSSIDQAVADAAAIEYAGMQMAQQWFDTIQQSKLEEQELRQELKSGYVDDSGNPIDDPQGKREWRASIEEAIRQNKIERVQAYYELVGRLTDSLRESLANAKDFKEAEQQRIREIQHNANSDMEGRPSDEHQMPANTRKKINNWMGNSLFAPLATYMEMLRLFGRKSANGEGYLFNRFGRGWIDARQQEIRGVRDKYAILDAKAKELFGGQVKTWGDLIRRVGKLPKGTVSFWNGGEMQEREMTQGNLMYIYMVNKMLDGRMKLRKMGISEEDVAEIERALDPRLIELADWMQDEFLVQTRNEYNETHKRMFGASMAAIEHYFPLRVLKNAIDVKAEDLDKPEVTDGISTITGGIIKRRRNSKPLDILNADALHVILSHVAEMEHWNAYAEFNRDLNTLRSYRHFRNQVQNMNTIYGNGKNLWEKFNDVCQMATGAYKPKGDGIEKAILSAAQGVTAAKVAFRIFTALKQFASLPAYFPYVRADYLVKSMARPDVSWSWCMEHLPIFEERWKSRVSGDPRLAKSILTAADWRQNLAVKVARAGMAPNAFVDALTVSMGAYAVYQTRKGQYLRDGYSEEQAERRAIQDTEMVYNETQQSGESAFTSTMQTDRTWWKVMFSVFRNSSMAYQRQLHGALRDLGNMMKEGGVSERLAFMKKQMIRDGLSEEQADAASKRRLRRQLVKDGLAVATFGYIMQLAWNMTGYLPYLLFGDDDETKDEFWDDIWAHTMGGWLEGLTGGDVMSLGIGMWRNGEVSEWKLKKEMPLTTDLYRTGRELFKGEYGAFVTDAVNLCVQMGLGMNPQSITDGVLAIMDACGDDPALAHEATICISRILQVPQSQIDKMYFDEVGLSGDEVSKYTPAQLAERYAEFKVKRGRFFAPWSWDDEGQIGKYIEKANKTINERTEQMGDKKVNEAYLKYEEVYKGVKSARKALEENKIDYVKYAEMMRSIQSSIQSDTNAFETYQMFKPMDGKFNEIVKSYLGAKTSDEAALCRQAVLDYKSAMVKVLEAQDVSTRDEAIDSLRAVMQDFDDAQSRLRSAE